MAWQEGFEFDVRHLFDAVGIFVNRAIRNVLSDDRAAREDEVAADQIAPIAALDQQRDVAPAVASTSF